MNSIYYILTYPLMTMTQGHQVRVFTLYLIFGNAVQVMVYLKYRNKTLPKEEILGHLSSSVI